LAHAFTVGHHPPPARHECASDFHRGKLSFDPADPERIEVNRMEATGVLPTRESTTTMPYIKARRGVSPRQMSILFVCMLD
jgi:hypothetical protein